MILSLEWVRSQIWVAMEFPVVSSEAGAVLNDSSAAQPSKPAAQPSKPAAQGRPEAECADGNSTTDDELLETL